MCSYWKNTVENLEFLCGRVCDLPVSDTSAFGGLGSAARLSKFKRKGEKRVPALTLKWFWRYHFKYGHPWSFGQFGVSKEIHGWVVRLGHCWRGDCERCLQLAWLQNSKDRILYPSHLISLTIVKISPKSYSLDPW